MAIQNQIKLHKLNTILASIGLVTLANWYFYKIISGYKPQQQAQEIIDSYLQMIFTNLFRNDSKSRLVDTARASNSYVAMRREFASIDTARTGLKVRLRDKSPLSSGLKVQSRDESPPSQILALPLSLSPP